MKLTFGTLVAAVFLVLTLVPFLNGQEIGSNSTEPGTQAVPEVRTSPVCPHQFTSGKTDNLAYLQYCVADDGVITSIETPFGHPQLGSQGEGYGLCQESPATEYHDFFTAGDSGNWNSPQVVSLTATSIKISRSTSDGNWTLLQTISAIPATGALKIVMALTNHQPQAKVAYLLRFAHVDPDGWHGYVAGSSFQSAFAWNAYRGKFYIYPGLQLANAGLWNGYQHPFIQDAITPPNACAFALNADPYGATPEAEATSLMYVYVGTVPAHGTKTVTLTYRST
jgi:hypothetical protein